MTVDLCTYTGSKHNGIAPIKQEYLIPKPEPKATTESQDDFSKDQQRRRGMNTKRKFNYIASESNTKFCFFLARGDVCLDQESCRFDHDIDAYMSSKPPNLDGECPLYDKFGLCIYGLRCRFSHTHTTEDYKVLKKSDCRDPSTAELNWLKKDIQVALRKRTFDFSRSIECLKKHNIPLDRHFAKQNTQVNENNESSNLPKEQDEVPADTSATVIEIDTTADLNRSQRDSVKKGLDWRGKTYLTPLTTVGNLPFRRICKEFGVDITCGEMAMAENLLQGTPSEWSLVRRHETEDIFGIQICGGNPSSMTRCADLLNQNASMDFLDLNLGCPIDLVFNKGCGSGLFQKPRRLEQVVRAVSEVIDVPLTVKFRSGIFNDKAIAHSFIPKFKEWGAYSCLLHGRSRQQRYTKLADWNYIKECAEVAKQADIPLLGNGDIFSYEEFHALIENTGVETIAIGRGALVKPWIFTEIKERRHWDISSSERFDMMKRFATYGMEHWGTDVQGINKTRRFLLEMQSFLCRYIPVGLLEHVPQRMNDRPLPFCGRDDLETLMASDNVQDWIKLSERILGKMPDDFHFMPKHKSNSYETSG